MHASLDFSRLGDCLRQELLNGIHHVSRLIEKSVTGLCDPFKVLNQGLTDEGTILRRAAIRPDSCGVRQQERELGTHKIGRG